MTTSASPLKMLIELYPDRRKFGHLTVFDKNNLRHVHRRCYGKSDNLRATQAGNPTRNPLYRFGDIPTGTYLGIVEHKVMLPRKTYGPYPPIRMLPRSGMALLAAANGRAGLLIHSGDLSDIGILRPTHGCVRVCNETMWQLTGVLKAWSQSMIDIEVLEILIPISSKEGHNL